MIKLNEKPPTPSNERWSEVKKKIKLRWSKLNEEEIESVKDNLGLLSVQLARRYGFSDDFAKLESETFVYSLTNNNERRIEIENPKTQGLDSTPEVGEWYG
jgi:hypothetical protein